MSQFKKLFHGKFENSQEVTFKAAEKDAYLMFEKNEGLGSCTLSVKGVSEFVACPNEDKIKPTDAVRLLTLIKGCDYKLTLNADYAVSQRKGQGEAFVSICFVGAA
tara:strand:- start:1291 stop:1608 length:318 start_codon:yes stop_codon:yes gene_type:complete